MLSPSPESTGASRAAIEHHYDVGRDFYRLWLDEEMVYSSALWLDGFDDDLAGAQRAKLSWHAEAARAPGAARVLDVGCGWGAMARYLTTQRDVGEVVGLTLSSDQADAVEAWPGGVGTAGRITVRLEDWRAHQPDAPYDAIVSIGALEHFARSDLGAEGRRAVYRQFFERAAAWTVEGGWMALQSIAYEDADPDQVKVSAFLAEEVFPESGLPRLGDLVAAAEPTWRIVALRSDADHYEHTLHLWQRRLEANAGEAVALVGRETYRRYLRYLRVCRALFDRRVCTLYRLALQRRPDVAS